MEGLPNQENRAVSDEDQNRLNVERVLEEAENIEISAEDRNSEGKLLAFPEGPESQLDEEEWKMVRTPSFRKWFEGSVVVNENGEPKLMYHGSKATERFAEFRTEYDIADIAKNKSSRFQIMSFVTKGTHFTDNPVYIRTLLGDGKQIYRTFLNIKNPRVEDKNVTTDQLSKEAVEEMQKEGIDGIKTPEGGGVTYVAFEPDQIIIVPEKDIRI